MGGWCFRYLHVTLIKILWGWKLWQDVNIRIATKNGRPVECIMLLTHISPKTWISALMKASLWTTTNGKASWIVNEHQWHRQGTKLASGKIVNRSWSSHKNGLFHDSSVIVVDSTPWITRTICAYSLAAPLGFKNYGRTNYLIAWIQKKKVRPGTSVLISSPQTISSYGPTH